MYLINIHDNFLTSVFEAITRQHYILWKSLLTPYPRFAISFGISSSSCLFGFMVLGT